MKNVGDNSASSLLSPDLFSPDLFISDLHLCASRPQITTAFLNFLKNTAISATALYILGDLFEYWAGDDDVGDPHHQAVISAFRTLADSGVKIFFMHGNRDFLIAENFCKSANIVLLQDPTLINLHGKRALLSHGDELCTDDVAYQAFRHQVRNQVWQSEFLSQPLQSRKQQIEAIRMRSEHEKSQKTTLIMDVNQEAVNALLIAYDYPELLIHGHTHRPNEHHIQLNGHLITRWVLGDWYEQGSYLACDQHSCRSMDLKNTEFKV
jgi:UDP-2,3-diacylglucosamine hydrolase